MSDCSRFYFHEIAFTMDWLNIFDWEDVAEILEKIGLEYEIVEDSMNAEDLLDLMYSRSEIVRAVAPGDKKIVFSRSGILSEENYIELCGFSEDEVLEILLELSKKAIKKNYDEIEKLPAYYEWATSKNGGLKVVNPSILIASRTLDSESSRLLKKMADDLLHDRVVISSVDDLKRYVEKMNKMFHGHY